MSRFVTVGPIVARPHRLGLLCVGLVLLLSSTACGPVQYIAQVGGKAAAALAQAEREGSAVYAPYETTAANEYLVKAREEASRSRFETAISYGAQAEELANEALALTRRRKADANTGRSRSRRAANSVREDTEEDEDREPPASAAQIRRGQR